ncbi:membrane protein [Streptomyces aureoverticillatus]|nr:membrane protein [Streptomyces aureoverticillatus]
MTPTPANRKQRDDRGPALGAPTVAAAVLTGVVALYIALVAFGNITDFGTNQQFVRHVLAMDTTFKDEDIMWRAIESRALQDTAYVAIVAWETLAALVLITATVLWCVALRSPGGGHARARRLSTVGLLMLMLLFGGGFIGIGGEWFAMWQSKDWNGVDAATRVFTLSGIVLLFIHLPFTGRGPAAPAADAAPPHE